MDNKEGWEKFISGRNPAVAETERRRIEQLDRDRKEAREAEERLQAAIRKQERESAKTTEDERAATRQTQERSDGAHAEGVSRYYKERRASELDVVHETARVAGSSGSGIPEYYFIVAKNKGDNRYYVDLVRVRGRDETVVGLPDKEPLFRTEEFADEEEAKRRADELAQTGVEWREVRKAA